MSFQEQKAKVTTIDHDFGLGDGVEKVHFKSLSPSAQSRIFTSQLVVTGKDKDGDDKWGLGPKALQNAQLEAVAETVVTDETGEKKMFKLDDLKSGKVDPGVVAQLVELFTDNIGFYGPDNLKRQKEKAELEAAGEDPPKAG
jgi:hypothetical protein